MGTTLALIAIVGGVAALFLIEMFVSGNKAVFYQVVMVGVAAIALIALLVSLFFSDGVNGLGAVLAVVGLVAVGVFYSYGQTERPEEGASTSTDEEGS